MNTQLITPKGEITIRPATPEDAPWLRELRLEALASHPEACAAWARRLGLVILKLGVVTTNAPAIRCYERCGFISYGMDPKVIYYDGVYYDELLMARTI